ncbi:LptF/LptG family permease, partial [bacterium]|nr:LptF/LptG family permease [bacterium]
TEVYFDRQTLNFGDLGMKLERRGSGHRGDRELTIADMKRLIASKDSAIVKAQKAIVTLSEKAFYSAFVPAGKRSKTAIEALAVLRHRAKATAQAIDSQRSAIEAHRRFIRKYKVEIHKKITLPLACFFFLFLGAPVGVLARKGGVGVALGLGLGFFVIYWAFLIGGEELADRGFLAPWLAMWLPNIVLGISGSAILYRTVWSSRFSGFGFIARVSAWFGGLFRRKGSSK